MEIDPRGYLATDARIIAEDDVYIAIVTRVEKATIARNLPLLAALADLVPALKKTISRIL